MNKTSCPDLAASPCDQPMHRLILHFSGGVVLLSLVPLLQGGPFIFHDSGTYYLYGEHIVSEIRAAITRSRAIIPLGELEEGYVGARSPTYSLLLYLTARVATLWGVVAVQAAASALLLLMFSTVVNAAHWARCYWALVLVLAVGSSLPYFAAYAMPDVFAGLGALALILIVLHGRDLSGRTHLAAWSILALSASFHGTLPIVFAAAAAAGILGRTLVGRFGGTRLVVLSVVSALLAGTLAGPVYREAERRVFHPIAAPPFLTARVLEDGTGVAYLEEACADPHRFALCRLQVEAPVNSDTFLWNKAGEGGVYLAVDSATRQALREEQARFVIGTVLSRPVEQLRISLGNWWQQLLLVEVVEPLWHPSTQASYHLFQSTGNLPATRVTLAPEAALSAARSATLWGSLAGLFLLALWAFRSRDRDSHGRYVLVFLLILGTVIAVNAAVCGILSKPYPRYQARLIWLLPAALVLIAYHPRILQAINGAGARLLAHRRG